MKSDSPQSPGPNTSEPINVGSFAGAGLQFAIPIVIFLFLGQWIDKRTGTSPLFLLAGVFIGGEQHSTACTANSPPPKRLTMKRRNQRERHK